MILIYHHVAPPEAVPKDWAPIEGWDYLLSPGQLEGQLRKLLERGYRFVPLPELVNEIKRRGAEPPRTAAITFDDCWRDAFTQAFPVLQRLCLPATFFVTTAHLMREVEDPKRMNLAQLRELLGAGMTLGGHSRTHPNLATLGDAQALDEIAGCKQDLESLTGAPIDFFSYPFGAHIAATHRLVQQAGFVGACSAGGGAANTRWSLYWLYRDALTPGLDTPADLQALSPVQRKAAMLRARCRKTLGRFAKPILQRLRAS